MVEKELVDAVAAQLEQQQEAEAETRKVQAGFNSDIEEARKQILKKFSDFGKKKEYPLEIKQIADALMMQPVLIKPMQAYLQKLVAAIQKAINEAIANSANDQ